MEHTPLVNGKQGNTYYFIQPEIMQLHHKKSIYK